MSKLSNSFSQDKLEELDDLGAPPASVIYEVIARHGDEELSRTIKSLFWSGVAAGILISLSVFSEAAIRAVVGDVPWRPLLENLGYSVGFIIVVLGRLQLFTENTITTVAPLLMSPSRSKLAATTRLWSVVFIANMIGAAIAALYFHFLPVATVEISTAFGELSQHIFDSTLSEKISRGILAGVLIATMVWVMPNAGGNAFWVILLFTYIIALGDLTHVVAGSVEAFYAAIQGYVTLPQAVFSYIIPTLLGNVAGGTLVFTLLVYAQVESEIED